MPRRISPSARTAFSLVAALLLVAPAMAPLASASPRPVPVCGPCSDRALSHAAQSHGLSLSVESSTAAVRLDENTTETWTVRAELSGAGVDDLREDSSLARELVSDAVFRDVRAISARVEGDTLVAHYRTVAFATRSFGAYRLDGLRDDAGNVVYTSLGADRLTVVGPAGTTTALSPPHATADGRRVTFTELPTGWTVFAPAGPTAPVVASLAVADAVGVTLVSNLVGFLVVPGVLLAGGLLALRRLLDRFADAPSPDRHAFLVVGLGLFAVFHPLLTDLQPLVNDYAPSLLAGGVAALFVGVVGIVRRRLSRPLDVTLATLTASGGFLLGVLAVFALPLVVGDPVHATEGLADAFTDSLLALPVVCCFVFGVTSDERRPVGLGTVLAAFTVVIVTAFDLTTTPQFGLFEMIVALGGALVIVVVGVPFVALGRALSESRLTPSTWE